MIYGLAYSMTKSYLLLLRLLNEVTSIFGFLMFPAKRMMRSLAGLVIQATGGTEFEDGLRPGSPGGVLSDNPSVRTSSLVTLVL